MAQNNILVVEDEELMRSILRQLLQDAGHRVFTADSAENALEVLADNEIALTLTDIRMGGRNGIQLLDEIKRLDPDALVVIMTAYSSVDSAIAALRKGAYDYVTKPFVNEDLLQTIANALRQRDLFRENRALRRELNTRYDFSSIVGKSEALQKVFELVKKVSDTNVNVLVRGESGTGKELVAKSIHFNSLRSEKPFVAINCGALPESLLESELFGHVRGSFTGAVSDKKGLLRSAEGGTIFFDEIGDMPNSLQVKLLRAIQEHEFIPVGSTNPEHFDARIIAATNRDLEQEVRAGNFREDLFYRLNVLEITLPPLRERRDDIPLLVKHFASRTSNRNGPAPVALSDEAMDALINYDWPGNVRELENAIERAIILSAESIEVDSLPQKVIGSASSNGAHSQPTLEEVERRYILEVLSANPDDKAAAANTLGIDLSTLYRKLKRYDET